MMKMMHVRSRLVMLLLVSAPLAACSTGQSTEALSGLRAALATESTAQSIDAVSPSASSIEVGFSPGNAEALVVATIGRAQKSIRMAAYSFTSRPIATALLQAHARGVDVQIVVDKSQQTARYTSAAFLANKSIPVRTDSKYAIMHDKFLVIDGTEVETGSFNYTRAATFNNAENVLVVAGNPHVAKIYAAEWQRLWNESTPYVRDAAEASGDDYHKRDYNDRRHHRDRWH